MADRPHYGRYLRIDELLSLQRPPGADGNARELLHHDELVFIAVHQVHELWFRLILHELAHARDILGRQGAFAGRPAVAEEDVPRAVDALDRTVTILQTLPDAFGVLETMAPTSFLAFRDALVPASGFQSVQFRELEILLGLRDEMRPAVGYQDALDPTERERVNRRLGEMTLAEALYDWLRRTPIELAFPGFVDAYVRAFDAYVDRQIALQRQNVHLTETQREDAARKLASQKDQCRAFLTGHDDARNRAHASFLFIATYRDEPLLRWPYQLVDKVAELEEHLRLWRFRHVRMVERMIGVRVGTGGSPGVDYLDRAVTMARIFGGVLEARTFLLEPSLLPPLPNPDIVRFAFR